MDNVVKILKSIIDGTQTHQKFHKNGILQPIYWSEDSNGNVNFDIESTREEFENLLFQLQQHNDNSDFDWEYVE